MAESKESSFRCQHCDAAFTRKDNLKRHTLIHTGEKAFRCEFCDAVFRKDNLKRHRLIHTGEKAFRCELCGAAFRQHYNLNRHMMTHTGERAFKCELCEASYRRKYLLDRHMMSHARETFHLKKDHLMEHTHTEETYFKCELCDDALRRESNHRQLAMTYLLRETFQRLPQKSAKKKSLKEKKGLYLHLFNQVITQHLKSTNIESALQQLLNAIDTTITQETEHKYKGKKRRKM